VSARHYIPRWTLAGRLGGSRSGESREGGFQKDEVGRRTLRSQVAVVLLVAVLSVAETGREAASTGGQRTPLLGSCRPTQQRAF